MKDLKSLVFMTCMDSCNGMCRRVLSDIEKSNLDKNDLVEAYFNDKNSGGRDYGYIIKLGELLKELEEKSNNLNI